MKDTNRLATALALGALLVVAVAALGARTECVPIEPVEPACPGENPQGCVAGGCPEGLVCAQASSACVPTGCVCDEAIGAWACTPDCSGGVCVAVP